MNRKSLLWSLATLGSIAASTFYRGAERQQRNAALAAKISKIVSVGNHLEVSCAEVAATGPIVLLALGQSNAGNYGTPASHATDAVTLIAEGKCIKAIDTLPGGTWAGGSIWQRIPALLAMQMSGRPVVLSILAVDATSIEDWTHPDSPLQERLSLHVKSMSSLGLAPTMVLWQQGEADSRERTGTEAYINGLFRLVGILNQAGSNAPIILARSTICQSAPNTVIRSAIDVTTSRDSRFHLGPDTDTLSAISFRSGCHLTAEDLDRAAKMWVTTIRLQSNRTPNNSLSSETEKPRNSSLCPSSP